MTARLALPRGGGARAALILTTFALALLTAVKLRVPPVEARDQQGRTALQRAALFGDIPEMRRLLDAGAQPDSSSSRQVDGLRSFWGIEEPVPARRPAIAVCAARCDAACVRLLAERGSTQVEGALLNAISRDCPAVAETLISGPLRDSLHRKSYGRQFVVLALRQGRGAILTQLLEAGAEPDHGDPPGAGLALAMAHCSESTTRAGRHRRRSDEPRADAPAVRAMVESLATHGAGLDGPDTSWGLTPLDWANLVCRSPELVGVLEGAGASAQGGSDAAVRAALLLGDVPALRAAFRAGGSPQQSLPDGRTLLQWSYGTDLLAAEIRRALATP